MDVGDDAMGGEDGEAFAAGVDESHHRAFIIGIGIRRIGTGAALVAVVERCFVAMVAVGDDEFLISHRLLNGLDAIGFGDGPEAVNHTIFVGELCCGRRSGFGFSEDGVDALLRIGIEHEELASVGASVAQEFEAIGFGSGERVFVAEDDAGGIFLETSGTDEAATDALFG